MREKMMKISDFAKAGGVSVETVRFYQRKGLLPIPIASRTSYREYDLNLLQQLFFIRKAQVAGFLLAEIKELLTIDSRKNRKQVQAMTRNRLEKLKKQIDTLQETYLSLKDLLDHCEKKSAQSACPIIQAFGLYKM